MMISTVFLAMLFGTLYSSSTINAGVLDSNDTRNGEEFLAANSPSYSNTLQHKLDILLTGTLSQIDTTVKNIQEQAHTWAIFRHNIDAWNDQMKTLESKLELIKRTQDEQQNYGDKLTSLELTLNHILSKVVFLTDTNSIPSVNEAGIRRHRDQLELAEILRDIEQSLRADNKIKSELSTRLSNILRHVQNIENDQCGRGRRGLRLATAHVVPPPPAASCDILKREFRHLNATAENNALSLSKILKSVTNTEQHLDDHVSQMSEQCQSMSTTFTESSDLLLKRIELLVSEKPSCYECCPSRKPSEDHGTTDDDDDDDAVQRRDEHEADTGDRHAEKDFAQNHDDDVVHDKEHHTDSTTDPKITDVDEEDVSLNEVEFVQPEKIGCHELDDDHERVDGIYKFSSPELNEAGRDFNERFCAYATSDDIAWTVIQNRAPYAEQENFNRSWAEYRNGFGSLYKDFWFGNEFIHQLVYRDDYELRIELEDFDGVTVWAQYSIFRLEPEEYNYNLLVTGYLGDVPDAMAYNNEMDFSSYDQRNDNTVDACCACATGYASGWWFNKCTEANLNGVFHTTPTGHNYVGIIWEQWHGDYSLKNARMLIRPKQWTPTPSNGDENEETQRIHNEYTEDP